MLFGISHRDFFSSSIGMAILGISSFVLFNRPQDTCIAVFKRKIEIATGLKGKYRTVRTLETDRIEAVYVNWRFGSFVRLEFVLDEGTYALPFFMRREAAKWLRGLLLSLMAAWSP